MSADSDAEAGLPAPRETLRLFGHDAAEGELAHTLTGGRGHHAWLICGPKGVGKATLAYRFARRLLGAKPAGGRALEVAAEDPVAARVAALTHPDLFVLRRGLAQSGKLKRDITVDEARALTAFFTLQPALGGFRVAIVDAADDLNRSAANALLKTLEEPPKRAALILIAHAPGGLLATIRSRCRRLTLRPLDASEMAAALAAHEVAAEPALLRLAAGRPGRALALAARGGVEAAAAFEAALARAPRDGGQALAALAFAREGEMEGRLEAFLEAGQDWCRRAAWLGAGAAVADEDDPLARLATPQRAALWAEAYGRLTALRDEAEALSLDPAHAYVRAAAILAETARAA